jgi:UDP-N-acetylmuramyl pentapeptide phosphotransferase/UDP-N-acetylglucosamine-1-phosphate transferase
MTSLTIPVQDLKQAALFMVLSFVIAILLAPILTNFLYKNKVGKRLRQHGSDGEAAPIFSKLHAGKSGTPVMGGLLFWVTTCGSGHYWSG